MVPLLQDRPLFVPDLPGYGNSAPTDQNDKVSVGFRIIKALRETINQEPTNSDKHCSIVLIGHDRGARVAHEFHVSTGKTEVFNLRVIGLALLDIVPTLYQWEVGDSAAAQTGYFHWSFLANVAIAKPMIMSYGGGKWATTMINRWAGSNTEGLEKLKSGDSLTVYSSFFDQESIIEASCLDYEAGSKTDLDFQTKAIENHQGIVVPLLLIYSKDYLPRRAKKSIEEVWSQPWTKNSNLITSNSIGNGIGHFLPEEAPELTSKALINWLSSL